MSGPERLSKAKGATSCGAAVGMTGLAIAASTAPPAVIAADAPVRRRRAVLLGELVQGHVRVVAVDPVKNQYRLMLTTASGQDDDAERRLAVPALRRDARPGLQGQDGALYSRCTKSDGTGCDAWRYSLADKKEVKLAFNSDDDDEGWPSQWYDQFAWVEVRGYGTAYQTDPDSRCDRPLSKTVEGNVVKLNAHGSCGSVTGQVVRGKTIVQTVNWNQQGADGDVKKYSELRIVPAKGGAGTRIAISKFYQGGSDILSAPQIDDKYVYAVRSGVGAPSQFVRFPRNKGKDPKGLEVDALTPLAGPMARDGSTVYYLEGLPGDPGSPLTPCSNIRPCPADEGGPERVRLGERRLAPRLTFGMPPFVLAPQPLTLSGSLTVPVVKQGSSCGRNAGGRDAPGSAGDGSQRAQRGDGEPRPAHRGHGRRRFLDGHRPAAAAAARVLRGDDDEHRGGHAVAVREAQGGRDRHADGDAVGRGGGRVRGHGRPGAAGTDGPHPAPPRHVGSDRDPR